MLSFRFLLLLSIIFAVTSTHNIMPVLFGLSFSHENIDTHTHTHTVRTLALNVLCVRFMFPLHAPHFIRYSLSNTLGYYHTNSRRCACVMCMHGYLFKFCESFFFTLLFFVVCFGFGLRARAHLFRFWRVHLVT